MICLYIRRGQVAQSVEQETENFRVGGSIPSLTTFFSSPTFLIEYTIYPVIYQHPVIPTVVPESHRMNSMGITKSVLI